MSNPFNTTDDGEKVLNILSAYRLSLNIGENFYYFSFWFWAIRLVEDNSCLLLAWPINRTLLRLAWNYFHTQLLMCLFQTALVEAESLLPWMHFVSVLLHTHMRESPLKHTPVFYWCKWFLGWNRHGFLSFIHHFQMAYLNSRWGCYVLQSQGDFAGDFSPS